MIKPFHVLHCLLHISFLMKKKKSCIYIHECIVVTMMKCWWWNVKDLGQTGSDIKHMLTIGLHKNTTKYLFKKRISMYTVINIALLSIEMLQLNWCLESTKYNFCTSVTNFTLKNEGSSKNNCGNQT